MYLEVTPHGSKLWRLKYRFANKENRISFGSYPLISLKGAREKREAARKLLDAGIDPSSARKQKEEKAALDAGNTFELVAREWHVNQSAKWTPLYARELLHRMDKDIFPALGRRPITGITAPELLALLRKIENRGAHEIAHRARNVCSQVFRYGIATGRAERDIAADLRGALKSVKHTHFNALDEKDLPGFLKALHSNEARLYPQTCRAVKLLMLTFVRTSELIGASWDEIDLEAKQWNIPAERMKMKRPHVVPLSNQALALLKEQHEHTRHWEFVFPNVAHPKKTMSNATILGAIRRMGYKDKTTGHGFRALAMTLIQERLGYRHEVVDRQLAHAPRDKVDAAYNRTQFLDERKIMMQEWADYLEAVVSQNKIIVGKFRRIEG